MSFLKRKIMRHLDSKWLTQRAAGWGGIFTCVHLRDGLHTHFNPCLASPLALALGAGLGGLRDAALNHGSHRAAQSSGASRHRGGCQCHADRCAQAAQTGAGAGR